MEYMLINHSDETDAPSPESPDFQAHMGRWMAFNQMLIDNGHWINGASLAGSTAATTESDQTTSAEVEDRLRLAARDDCHRILSILASRYGDLD